MNKYLDASLNKPVYKAKRTSKTSNIKLAMITLLLILIAVLLMAMAFYHTETSANYASMSTAIQNRQLFIIATYRAQHPN